MSVFSSESSEKPLLSPDCAGAMDFANMCKQRLVLNLRLPALTGKIGRIHSKQGSSEVSVFRSPVASEDRDRLFRDWLLFMTQDKKMAVPLSKTSQSLTSNVAHPSEIGLHGSR